MVKCTLQADINTCPFCNKVKMECNNEKKCIFQQDNDNIVGTQNGYVRKERWYEKYYKK